jgi:hypothetical protein
MGTATGEVIKEVTTGKAVIAGVTLAAWRVFEEESSAVEAEEFEEEASVGKAVKAGEFKEEARKKQALLEC